MIERRGEMAKEVKKGLYKAKAAIVKALAHPLRLEIVDVLAKGERCVEDIAKAVSAERSNVSRHLMVLASADLLNSRKEGLNVYYSLKCPCIMNFFDCVEQVLREQLDEKVKLLKK
jgi:ArsR family transcriptional regulator